MLRIIIDNQKISFDEAVNKQFEVFQIFAKYGAITHIRDKKKDIPVAEINKDYIKKVMLKRIKIDLRDPNDLDSSRIGYSLWLPTKSFERASSFNITFGKPEITGGDIIMLDPHSKVLPSKFQEVALTYYSIIAELISIVNPTDVVFQTHELKLKVEDKDYDYGFIMFKNEERLKELDKSNSIKLEKLGKGYIWKSDFSSYENGLATVIETWKPELATI